jgi:ribose-phosphate pyrophosphokinase
MATMLGIRTEGEALPRVIELEERPVFTESDRRMLIFGGTSNPQLADEICRHLGISRAGALVGAFKNEETRVRIEENVRGADVFVIQSTCSPVDHHIMELLLMIDALRRASANRVTAVIPYYGYARKDRKDEGRVPISAKLVANLLVTAGVHRVITVDLHAQQIQGFFDIPVDHLWAAPTIARHFRDPPIPDLTVVAPDVGSSRMARGYANRLGGDLAIVDKKRISADRTETVAVIGNVRGRNVVMVDDMISTAGSITEAARTVIAAGAKSVRIAATHGVLCGPARERLANAPVEELILTDTIRVDPVGLPKLRVLSIAGLLSEAIRRVHEEKSISVLFTRDPEGGPGPKVY